MVKRILVTGATGTIGQQTVENLLAYPITIRAGIHNYPLAPPHQKRGVEAVAFAFDDPATYAPALEGVESLFILPPSSYGGHALIHPFLDYITQYRGSLNHIVSLSAMSITPSDGTPYGAVESHVQATGIPYTFLRPNWFMQNFNNRYSSAIRQQRLLALPAGEAYTSFVDTRDVGAVAAKVLANEIYQWEALTLTGWESLNYSQVAEILSENLGVSIQYSPQRDDAMRVALGQHGWDTEAIDAMLGLFQNVRNGNYASLSQDVARVLDRPPIPFSRYVVDHIAAWK